MIRRYNGGVLEMTIRKEPLDPLCEGCATAYITYRILDGEMGEDQYFACAVKPSYNGIACPCSICIVKTTCGKGCGRFKTYLFLIKEDMKYKEIEEDGQ